MGFIDWIKGAANWINEKVLQPVGRWGSALWNGMTGKGRPGADPNDVATNAGYQSGQWFRGWGLPVIKSAANILAPGVGAGIEEMQKGVERATGSKLE
ncbi:MAG: hypothetical protein ACR2IJ_05990 [Fluviibacter sp.]